MTASGWGAVWMVSLGVLAGLILGWTILLSCAGASAVFLGIAVLSLRRVGPHAVTLELPSRRVTVGATACCSLSARNTGTRHTRGCVLEIAVAGELHQIAVPALKPHGVWAVEIPVPTRRRGVVEIGPVWRLRGDIFGLLRAARIEVAAETVPVHPVTIDLSPPMRLHPAGSAQVQSSYSRNGMEFEMLRPYRRGDRLTAVVWRITGGVPIPVSKQFVESSLPPLVILLSVAKLEYTGVEEFELAVSSVASVGVSAVARGRPVMVHSGSPSGALIQVPGTAVGVRRLLDTLAAVQRQDRAPGLVSLCTAATSGGAGVHVPEETSLLAVTGAGAAPGTWSRCGMVLRTFALRLGVQVGTTRPGRSLGPGSALQVVRIRTFRSLRSLRGVSW